MLKEIESKGVYNAIDWCMMKNKELQIGYCSPMIVKASIPQTSAIKDTDVQVNGEHKMLCYSNVLEWDIDEIYNIHSIITKSVYGCKLKSINLKLVGIKEYPLKFDERVLVNSKDYGDIEGVVYVYLEFSAKNVYNHICIFPNKGDIKSKIKELNGMMVKWYYTQSSLITVPSKYLTNDVMNSIVWEDTYLNTIKPF